MAGNRTLVLILSKWTLFSVISSVICLNQKANNHGYEPSLELTPGKETFQMNYISYYMYNITNPDEFEAGEKPEFEEVGPYTYRETRRKFNVNKVSNSIMSYTLDRYWEFMPELSAGHDETDEFNVINIPLIILANKLSAKRLPKAFNDILVEELTEKGESLVRRNEEIGNVIYYGMNVTIYTEILADVLQGNVPKEFSDGLFALFKGKNGTAEGFFTVSTKDNDFGDILSYNNKTKLEYWDGDLCNQIQGTDGYFFRPGANEKSSLKIFYPELCRSVYLRKTGEKQYKGINVSKFSFPEDMLEDPKLKPENTCFCSKPIIPTNNSLEGCLKKGFIDYASCKQDSPLLISYPHFLHASDEYREKLVGMKPIKEKHESEFLVEPKTGIILSGMRKFQFNVKLRPLDNVEIFRNTTFNIVPVFSVYKQMIVPENRVEKLKEDLKKLSETSKNDQELHDEEKHLLEEQSVNILSDQPKNESQADPEPESVAEENDASKIESQNVTKNSASNLFMQFPLFSLLILNLSFNIIV